MEGVGRRREGCSRRMWRVEGVGTGEEEGGREAQWARTVGQAILGIFLGIGHTECHFIGLTCVKFTF